MSEITGIYRFFQDGVLIREQKNGLTQNGKTLAIKTLLGINQTFVNSIGLGIDSASNSLNSSSTIITNNILGFEIGRIPVITSSFEVQNGQEALVFSGEITDSNQYNIYEIGIFSAQNNNSAINLTGELILSFDNFDTFNKYGTASSGAASAGQINASARIGADTYYLGKNQNSTTDYIEIITNPSSLSFLDNFKSQDLFKLAMVNTCVGEGASVYFRLHSNDTDYYELKFVSDTASGYKVLNVTKGSAVINGTPDWLNINKIKIFNATTSSFVLLDGFKIDYGTYYIDTNFGLISRANLNNPILKTSGTNITVEYSLLLNFNGGV